MTPDRDELARDLSAADADTWEKMAENLLAAGWRKPRTITTVDELMNLPAKSVILSLFDDVLELSSVDPDLQGRWAVRGGSELDRVVDVADLPAVVLWTPGAAK